MCHLILGDTKGILTMFVRKKKYPSGNIGVIVVEKIGGKMKDIDKPKIEIRPMFHFTRKRIEAHICICFVALKVYKELERMLKVSEIKMSIDKVLALAKTITTIQIKLPLNKEVYTQTMLMARHQKIAKLFDEDFWGTQ